MLPGTGSIAGAGVEPTAGYDGGVVRAVIRF
jgi:hypothetical protein